MKKWKDRFIVLRACKTIECFKSKKALESSKSPRKVIDIRECINLEVGLEYKELQHIFSLGTFKRAFFFAAPSDALMLQWVDNIEKVKNAIEGELDNDTCVYALWVVVTHTHTYILLLPLEGYKEYSTIPSVCIVVKHQMLG